MKTSLRFLVTILIITLVIFSNISTSFGQTPNEMSYQAIIRDANGQLLTSQSVSMQFSILQGSTNGTAVYIETHSLTTNENGMVSLNIGNGNVVSGNFATIDWANGSYFIKTETDPTGGNNYTISGTNQLLSVPYALHAKTAEAFSGTINETDPVFTISQAANITSSDISKLANISGTNTGDQDLSALISTEEDPVFMASPFGNLSQTDIDEWNNKLNEFIESDPLFAASLANGITATDTTYWNSKLDEFIEIDPTFLAHPSAGITQEDITKWSALWIWYTTNEKGYISTETDPIFETSIAKGITAADTTAWNNDIGATEIDDLSDAKTDVGSIFLGSGAGANDDGTNNQNVAVGIDALKANTSGNSNTANGFRALYSNTSGSYNTANGRMTLYSSTDGYNNTANGYEALMFNTIGNFNTANGKAALYYNTTGSSNTANGSTALYKNTTGSYNTASGYRALIFNVSGSNNTAIGYEAGNLNASGSGNIFLGKQAGYNETGSDKLYIENSDITTPLIYGDFFNDSLRINGKLEVSGTVKIEGGSPGAGKVLTSDANGVASWVAGGATEIDDLSDAKTDGNSVFLGSGAGANDDGNRSNVAVGINALNTNTTGNSNTANGSSALYSNTTGNKNTANGSSALYSNTTGGFNTANGSSALSSNTTGNENTANGSFALFSNTTGAANTANGSSALYSNTTGYNNTANGSSALSSNTTGFSNTANGSSALSSNTTGSANTANGSSALSSNTTGYYNTANGYAALSSNTTGASNTANGYTALISNTTGNKNTANGFSVLMSNTTGNENTANGYAALSSNTTGSNNSVLGDLAGYLNVTGSRNLFLGYKAGYNETGSDKLYIENSDASTPLIYGDFANDSLRINGKLEVSGTLKIEGGTPTDGYLLTSDANGVASWQNKSWDSTYASIKNTPVLTAYATKDMANAKITNLADPSASQDAATKAYVDLLKGQIEELQLLAGIRVKDADGNVYDMVTIGTQTWMTENLKTTKYNDGTDIPYLPNSADYLNPLPSTPAYTWYNNDEATYKSTYGALYSYFTVATTKLCPTGWHVPSDAEWTTLATSLGGVSISGGFSIAGGKLKESGAVHWFSGNTSDNSSGFTGLPGGYRYYNGGGGFLSINQSGHHWSSTVKAAGTAWQYILQSGDAWSGTLDTDVKRQSGNMPDCYSVRCIKD